MNPRTSDAPINTDDLLSCPCHGTVECPDRVTVAVPADQLADLADLLTTVDEFLRCGTGVADRLADFYAGRGDRHPGFAASNLIDQVSFTAAALHRHREGDRP
jgi:hypothetical protein